MYNKIKGLQIGAGVLSSIDFAPPNYDALPPITEEEMHQSDNFFIPITVSTNAKYAKTTSGQSCMSWQTLNLNPWQLIEKLKNNYIYCGAMFKPFTQSNPKAYKKYDFSARHGFCGKFTSYFHLYSTSIVSVDVDAFHTDKTLDEIYNILRYYNCHPTFLYTTSSDLTNKETGEPDPLIRHFRMLYWLDSPIYASPIIPIYDKDTKQYIWDEKDDTRARKAANKNYSYVCRKLLKDIEYAYFALYNKIDFQATYTATTRYNGNAKANFKVVGDFHILHTPDYISQEDNQPYEPIENFKTQEYNEHIKKPRELNALKGKEANAKIRAYNKRLNKSIDNIDGSIRDGTDIFNLGKVNLTSIVEHRYNLLKGYELIIYNTSPPKVPENERLILSPEEFKLCSDISKMYKTVTFKKDVYINKVEFLTDFSNKENSLFDLFLKYKNYYSNQWQTHQIEPFASNKKFPKFGYKVIYNTLPWQFTPLKHHKSAMQMYAGLKRKDNMRQLSIGRRIIYGDITYDNLLFNSMVDFLFFTKDITSDGVVDEIVRDDIAKVASYVWNIDKESKSWKFVNDKITRKPSRHDVDEQMVLDHYDPSLKYDELRNILLKEENISISDSKLRRILKANGIRRYKNKDVSR